MSPGPRRDLTPFILVLAAGAVVLFLIVGGLASVGRSSGPFHSSTNQSFGAQARVLAAQSNAVGAQLRSLLNQMTGLSRPALTQALDAVVNGADDVETDAVALSPAPSGQVGSEFVSSMANRALGASRLRRTIDGLLQLTPGPPSNSTAPLAPLPPPAVSADQATTRFTAVGALLLSADRSYAAARKEFAKAVGGSELPKSVWVSDPVVWGAGAIQTTVGQLTSAPNLAPSVDVHLVAVQLSPPLLPPVPNVQGQPQAPPLAAGAAQIPPTCTLSLTAVVRNDGTIAETKVPVSASVQSLAGGAPFVVQKRVTIGPSGSVALTLQDLPVAPSGTYTLTVGLQPPAGQTRPTGQESATIAVASYGSAKVNHRCARTPAASP